MTSFASLFTCAASDVTFERIKNFIDQGALESVTVEFKEKYSPKLIRAIASMANSYGGLILVGVTDSGPGERFVGVQQEERTKIATSCNQMLVPPWEPEIIPVSIPNKEDLYVLVVRVERERAPRPVFWDGLAPIRLAGSTANADRDRLAQLFAEPSGLVRRSDHSIPHPQILPNQDGSRPQKFLLRSGLQIPVLETTAWRPFSDTSVASLAKALNNSPLNSSLTSWSTNFGIDVISPFSRQGLNRSRIARLTWQANASPGKDFVVSAVADVRSVAIGTSPTTLILTLDIDIGSPTCAWILPVPDLYKTLEAVVASLVDPNVVQSLADLSGIDFVLVPPPTNIHFLTGDDVKALLNMQGLTAIAEAGHSEGASLVADPALDLLDAAERRMQLDVWMTQIALDAGLSGMEGLLPRINDL